MATISTHNGSEVARQHNLRTERVVSKESHIDPEGVYEVWYDEPPRQAYEKLFGEAVKEYNHKQTRGDRQIDDYYKKILKDEKKHPVYEMIVGVYDDNLSPEKNKQILKEFFEGWSKRNPNLYLVGAYFHNDEQGKAPHLHLDYIPVGKGYSKGLSVQSSLSKALEGQGFFTSKYKKQTAQILWQSAENKTLEDICKRHGLEVEHPQAGKGVKHKTKEVLELERQIKELTQKLMKGIQDYNKLKTMTDAKDKELQRLDKQIQSYTKELQRHSDTLDKLLKAENKTRAARGQAWSPTL